MTVARLHPSEALAAHEAVILLRSLAELWGEDENDLYVSDMTVTNGVNEVVFTIVRDDDGLDDWVIEVEADDHDDCDPHGIERPRLRSRDLQPGDVIKMTTSRSEYTIRERKPDDTGWWIGEGGGFSDYALDDYRWERVEP